jgi:hypothetical protein
MLRRLSREPLVHFLAVGGLLFAVYAVMNPPVADDSSRRIVVDAATIARLQSEFASQWQRPPNRVELATLVDDHVRQEILYREAVALGLDRTDRVVRQRLAHSMEQLALMGVEASGAPQEAELRAYLAANPAAFAEPAMVSFSHVFVNPDVRGRRALDDARALLDGLTASGSVGPALAGDPWQGRSRYDGMTRHEAARLFGRQFAERLFELPPGSWQGPVESGLGLHLVLVTESVPAQVPPFEEIALAVRSAYLEHRQRERRSVVLAEMRRGYEIEIAGLDGTAGR